MNFEGMLIKIERDSLKGMMDFATSWLSLFISLIFANSESDGSLIISSSNRYIRSSIS